MSSRPCLTTSLHHTPPRSIAGMLRVTGIAITTGLLLAGCAAQVAYRDGKNLVEQGNIEQGLMKFHEAAAADPDNAEYKQAYLQTRERTVYQYLQQADQFALSGKQAEAEQQYRRVLDIDTNNERAHAGLRRLEDDRRHRRLLEEGQAALAKKDRAEARLKLSTVLKEDPHNTEAAVLQHAIDGTSTPPPIEATLSTAYRKPVTLEFKDAPLKQVFEVLSRTSGLNFLFDKDVKLDQKTSIFLKNSTVDAAVHFTLMTNQLEQQILDNNTILIYPSTAAKLKDYQEMVVKSFFLSNAEAKTVANTLKTILKTRDIVVDDKLNMLIVRDSPEAIRLAEKLVALQDTPEPEVMLEVEILEIKRTRLTELGIQWPNSLTLTPLPSTSGGTLTLRDLRSNLNGGTIGAGIGPVTLNARKADGDANLLANPRIRVRNHEKAKILIGERVPNITTTATSSGFVSESINYVDVGLKLDVEPTVYLDDSVAIKVGLEVSSVTDQIKTQSGTVAYQIGTRTANTVLRLKDGENQVLAGLLNNEERSTGNKVPGLGDVPILGRLFGSTTDDNQKTEIVLSITPHLIRNIRTPDAALSEFRSGTESSFRIRPDTIKVAPTPSAPHPVPAQVAALKTNVSLNAPQAMSPTASDASAASAAATGNSAGLANNGGAPIASGAHMQWQGPSQVKVGDTFSLQLMMQSDQPVVSVPATVAFDNKALQIVGINEGIFLKQGGAQTTFSSKLDPSGQIQLNGARSGSGGATSIGNVATLTFRALAPSDGARLQVMAATPTGPSGTMIGAALPAPFSVQVKQ